MTALIPAQWQSQLHLLRLIAGYNCRHHAAHSHATLIKQHPWKLQMSCSKMFCRNTCTRASKRAPERLLAYIYVGTYSSCCLRCHLGMFASSLPRSFIADPGSVVHVVESDHRISRSSARNAQATPAAMYKGRTASRIQKTTMASPRQTAGLDPQVYYPSAHPIAARESALPNGYRRRGMHSQRTRNSCNSSSSLPQYPSAPFFFSHSAGVKHLGVQA
jgi:hypothetical protein